MGNYGTTSSSLSKSFHNSGGPGGPVQKGPQNVYASASNNLKKHINVSLIENSNPCEKLGAGVAAMIPSSISKKGGGSRTVMQQ